MSIIDRLADRSRDPRTLEIDYLYLKDPDQCKSPGTAAGILSLNPSRMPDIAKEVLDALEAGTGYQALDAQWLEFKWRLFAFVSLVDVFDAPLVEMKDAGSVFRLWYFYFESKFLVIEALLCGLTGFHGAANSLLRPILEFSLTQNYFRRQVSKGESYRGVEAYLRDGRLPSWHRLAMDSVPQTKFGATVRFRAQSHLSALSESSSHAYAPPHSPKALGASKPEQTFDGLWGWCTLSLILDSVLWVYYANFPALFYPCDLMRRFGCNPPVGILVDTQLVSIVKRTLSAADYREFHGEASARFDDLRSFVESRPLLSDLEIVESYDNAREPMPQSPWEAFGRTMAHLRGMKEMMAWSQVKDEPVDDTATLPVHSLSWWTKVKKGTK